MNWHEFYALLLSGRPVVDWSDAGTWATYDVATGGWSAERIEETGIDPAWLPEIQPNGSPIGRSSRASPREFGLPADTLIVTGAFDTYAAAVGSAAVDPGVVSLACGTWNSYNMPVTPGWPVELVHDGIGVYPHPGPTGFGILVTNPNGMSVIDWARNLMHLSIPDLEAGLAASGRGPGHVFARRRVHAPAPRVGGARLRRHARGRHARRDSRRHRAGPAREHRVRVRAEPRSCWAGAASSTRLVRATGGGSKNAWWMQLIADLTGVPVEVVAQDEPGAFGAAILAGVGAGVYRSVSAAVAELVTVARRFEPGPARGALYAGVRARLGAG